jgi:hypothetical protein
MSNSSLLVNPTGGATFAPSPTCFQNSSLASRKLSASRAVRVSPLDSENPLTLATRRLRYFYDNNEKQNLVRVCNTCVSVSPCLHSVCRPAFSFSSLFSPSCIFASLWRSLPASPRRWPLPSPPPTWPTANPCGNPMNRFLLFLNAKS